MTQKKQVKELNLNKVLRSDPSVKPSSKSSGHCRGGGPIEHWINKINTNRYARVVLGQNQVSRKYLIRLIVVIMKSRS
ncbi:hypothetical protein GCM10027342_43490 [Photobacterium alginatilyticum]